MIFLMRSEINVGEVVARFMLGGLAERDDVQIISPFCVGHVHDLPGLDAVGRPLRGLVCNEMDWLRCAVLRKT